MGRYELLVQNFMGSRKDAGGGVRCIVQGITGEADLICCAIN
ncbi:hypothetical protein SLEP1_g14015 [Rubroshorea leprosula]|uniref:Uncharacterized protein n=1 Tax=Rubroshorea leprosula TaxID=152421 RepID=A0AAV5IM66_9ROSI|nr:hypothetical protein SLEP1_g14015 [Rubroshorea leprosula]